MGKCGFGELGRGGEEGVNRVSPFRVLGVFAFSQAVAERFEASTDGLEFQRWPFADGRREGLRCQSLFVYAKRDWCTRRSPSHSCDSPAGIVAHCFHMLMARMASS